MLTCIFQSFVLKYIRLHGIFDIMLAIKLIFKSFFQKNTTNRNFKDYFEIINF